MKCRLVSALPPGPEWLFEIKFDGYRAIAIKTGKDVRLISRNQRDFTANYPELMESLAQLPWKQLVLDGEVVALDEKGRSSFELMQSAHMAGQERPAIYYYAFDVLNFEGKDLTSLPLLERKALLERLLQGRTECVRYSAGLEGGPRALLALVAKHGLEGVVGKKKISRYEPGLRTGAWVKYKPVNEQEFVIGGYTAPEGARSFFGALTVGYYQKGHLLFASKVGTGFSHKMLKLLYEQFQKIRTPDCPFANLPTKREGRWGQGISRADMRRCTWVQPRFVCQVHFTEWTREGGLRHPAFVGLREDKNAREVVREIPAGSGSSQAKETRSEFY